MTVGSHVHGAEQPGVLRALAGRAPWLWALPVLAVVAAVALDPDRDGPTLCPFALCTGMACPGCGLTRAAGWLVRGDLGAAVAAHPLVFVVAAWAAGSWGVMAARARGRRLEVNRRAVDIGLAVTAGIFVATWIVRMAVGALPPV